MFTICDHLFFFRGRKDEESCSRKILWCPPGDRARGLVLSFHHEIKPKGGCCRFKSGERQKQQGIQNIIRGREEQKLFYGICRWRNGVFALPCGVFVPKQSHFVHVLILTGSPWMTADLCNSGSLAQITHFIVRETVRNSSLHRCLSCSQRWASCN